MVYVLTSPVRDSTVEVRPGPGTGFTVNGIPVDMSMVVRADNRIDLAMGDNRAFIIEHALACLTIHGVDSAEIIGVTSEFDPTRKTHEEARVLGLPASASVGPPDGRICSDLCPKVEANRKYVDRSFDLTPVHRKVRVDGLGTLTLEPCDHEGLEVVAEGYAGEARAYFDPQRGIESQEKRDLICSSVTPALIGFDSMESLWHAVGDLIGDLVGLGRIGGARATLYIDDEYHDLTYRALLELEK